jgi:hypothetical protein
MAKKSSNEPKSKDVKSVLKAVEPVDTGDETAQAAAALDDGKVTKKRVLKKTPVRVPSAKRPKETSEGYKIYYPDAGRDTYSKGDIVFFEKVRHWTARGELVEAFGKVVSVDFFDGEVPFLEVSFNDAKKLNKHDLGDDLRRYILEAK